MGDFISYRGDTFTLDVQVKDGQTCSPVDITGWLVWFTVKKYFNDPDNRAVYQARSDDLSGNCVITQPTIGKVRVKMPFGATSFFPDGVVRLVYDVQAKDPFGNITTVEVGTISVTPDVTRATV